MALPHKDPIRFSLLTIAALVLSICLPLSAARAQSMCVLVPDKQSPSDRVLRCGRALTVQPATGTSYSPVETAGARPVNAVRLDSGALLIDFHPSKALRNFQVLTPEAIASVRGTKWAMEAKSGLTSVLGLEGAVQVARANSPADAVVLRRGEGVDVRSSGEPLQVKHWAPQRVQALLARFGQ
ncbi:MAG TPA: FecR domain-containing protein [Roseiarcus sp.]|nr:FecR domain-containing protein [Roseiarcus sp.]